MTATPFLQELLLLPCTQYTKQRKICVISQIVTRNSAQLMFNEVYVYVSSVSYFRLHSALSTELVGLQVQSPGVDSVLAELLE